MKKHATVLGLVLVAAAVVSAVAHLRLDASRDQMEVTPLFSPNRDGVKDRAVVCYTLAKASKQVTLTIL